MVTKAQVETGRKAAIDLLKKAGILLSACEEENIDVADFGLSNYPEEGAQMVTLVDTKKVGFKVICLLEGQALPEHWHTASLGDEGKEETFRAVWGTTRIFVPGDDSSAAPYPNSKEAFYSCRKEIVLIPPQQITLPADTRHWLLGGPGGSVVLSISSWARCALDPFTDPSVVRTTVVAQD